ncbi:MAG: hypothetical protein L3K00_06930 [Thermoplasmata archaeon]|nr:hypothetical protein [Thermoplasmata archaeon]
MGEPAPSPGTMSDRTRLRFARMAWGLLGLLVIENLLGIFATLYITLPSGNAIPAIFTSYPVLALHVANGFLMLAAALFLTYRAHSIGAFPLRNAAALEVVFLALAIQEGFAYAATQNNVYSFGMDFAFLMAVLAVARMLFLLGWSPSPPTSGMPTAV